MKNDMAEDCDFVNIVGFHWKRREDVQYAHQTVHQTIFKDVPLEKRAVTTRFLTSDVAVAHVVMHPIKSYTIPDGFKGGDSDALATFVFVKKKDAWMVEAVENVAVSEIAKPLNPVLIIPDNCFHRSELDIWNLRFTFAYGQIFVSAANRFLQRQSTRCIYHR